LQCPCHADANAAAQGGKVVKELTSLQNPDLSPALRFAMAYVTTIWQLWQQGVLDDIPGKGVLSMMMQLQRVGIPRPRGSRKGRGRAHEGCGWGCSLARSHVLLLRKPPQQTSVA
jgi:hypothetical protein